MTCQAPLTRTAPVCTFDKFITGLARLGLAGFVVGMVCAFHLSWRASDEAAATAVSHTSVTAYVKTNGCVVVNTLHGEVTHFRCDRRIPRMYLTADEVRAAIRVQHAEQRTRAPKSNLPSVQ